MRFDPSFVMPQPSARCVDIVVVSEKSSTLYAIIFGPCHVTWYSLLPSRVMPSPKSWSTILVDRSTSPVLMFTSRTVDCPRSPVDSMNVGVPGVDVEAGTWPRRTSSPCVNAVAS